jgi:hypothetical protein
MEQQYLIWSVEHCAWWKPNRAGYTYSRTEAGRYTLEEARAICIDANAPHPGMPNECMVPV